MIFAFYKIVRNCCVYKIVERYDGKGVTRISKTLVYMGTLEHCQEYVDNVSLHPIH